jgi:hypothetical protein
LQNIIENVVAFEKIALIRRLSSEAQTYETNVSRPTLKALQVTVPGRSPSADQLEID